MGWGRLFKFRPLDKDDALPMGRKACAGEMRWRPGGRPGSESVPSTTLDTLAEQNRGQVGPTILFDRPPAGTSTPPLIHFPLGPQAPGTGREQSVTHEFNLRNNSRLLARLHCLEKQI
jgi:hypothetical protein